VFCKPPCLPHPIPPGSVAGITGRFRVNDAEDTEVREQLVTQLGDCGGSATLHFTPGLTHLDIGGESLLSTKQERVLTTPVTRLTGSVLGQSHP
jgi:hypothetical protein